MVPPVVQPGDVFQRARMPNAAGIVGEALRVASVVGDLVQFEWVAGGGTTNASLLTSGTLADARLSTNAPLLNAANTFTANQLITGTLGVSGTLTSGHIVTGSVKSNASSLGVIVGDSTSSAYSGTNSVASYMITDADVAESSNCTNLAVASHTIDQQKAVWLADANKATYDYIVVNIGHNDVVTLDAAATILTRYQSLITTINAGRKATAVVIVTTMTPAKSRYIELLGAINGATAYQIWIDVNIGIMGGVNAVTGVHYRIDQHSKAINDSAGSLATIYQLDLIHPNNAARKIIANIYRDKLSELGYFSRTLTSPEYVIKSDVGTLLVGPVSVVGTLSTTSGITVSNITTRNDESLYGLIVGRYSAGIPYSYVRHALTSSGMSFTDSAGINSVLTILERGGVTIGYGGVIDDNVSIFKVTGSSSFVGAAGVSGLLTASGGLTVVGATKLGNAAVAATPTPTHTITIQDSTGTTYRIPCLV